MNTSQIKNSIRFLFKKRNYLLVNVLGLGIGMASFLVLFLYVYNDYTYNHFHKNLSNIYRVREGKGVQTKGLFLPKVLEQVPEVENGTRIFDWEGFRINYEGIAFQENIQYVDTGFFSVFSFPFIEGYPKKGIYEKYGTVISRDFAKKYFGDEPAVGKKLQVRFDNIFLNVTGVADIPENSSIKFDLVTSYETGLELSPWIKDVHDWYNTFSTTYLLLKPGIKPESIDDKFQHIVHENFFPAGENKTDVNLLAFTDFHASQESNPTLIIILSIVAFGILCIAIVNFINLTISNSLTRTKEFGIKKVVGAGQSFLARQIISESLIVSLIALIGGCILSLIFLPTFNQLFNTKLHFNPFHNQALLFTLLTTWLLVGLFSGLIPALFWSRLKLMSSLRGQLFKAGKIGMTRYSLVIVQFIIAIILISGTLVVRKQINFMINHDPQFDKENVIVTQLDSWQYEDLQKASAKYKLIAEELKSSPFIESVCFSQCIPGTYFQNYNRFYPESQSNVESIHLRKAYVGRNYFKTFGIKLLDGDGFENQDISYNRCMVLNKKAMQELGYDRTDNQILRESSKSGTPNKIIGQIDDFSYQGVQHEMQPLAHIFTEQENYYNWNYLAIKTNPGTSLQVVELLKQKWNSIPPESPLSYFFADDKLNEQYKEYTKINEIIAWFSIVAIVLSCIGLFALSAYAASRRIKEIGIRKVNGAKIAGVVALLNREFLKWVLISFVVATPVSLFALTKWLEGFALRTTLNWWIFVLAGLLALAIAILTVSFQSLKAAIRNPVESLRYE